MSEPISLGEVWSKTFLAAIGVGLLVRMTGGPLWVCVAVALVFFLLFLIIHILYRISDDIERLGIRLAPGRDESSDTEGAEED